MDRRKKRINREEPELFQPGEGYILPKMLEAEASVLGAIISFPEHKECMKVLHMLKAEVFSQENFQLITESIITLRDKGSIPEMIALTDELRKAGHLENVGGPYALDMLSNKVKNLNVEHWWRIVYQDYLRRKLIEMSARVSKASYTQSTDVFTLLDEFIDELEAANPEKIFKPTTGANEVADEFIKEYLSDLPEEHTGSIYANYETGHQRFDDVVTMSRSKIILLAGGAKAGKSKFTSNVMFKMLEAYNDIAVLWITLEDDRKDVLRAYLAGKVMIKPKWLKERRFPASYKPILLEYTKQFQSFDIQYIDQSLLSRDIVHHFHNFCQARPDKFNILIVDNIMSLADRENYPHDLNAMYDYVMQNILIARQRTGGLIWVVHHYNDAQQDEKGIDTAYRPRLQNIKGTEAFRRVPNQVLMLNNFKIYRDLLNQYQGDQKEIMKHITVIDTGANREDDSDESYALIHFFCNLDFTLYKEIEIPVKEENKPEKEAEQFIRQTKPF